VGVGVVVSVDGTGGETQLPAEGGFEIARPGAAGGLFLSGAAHCCCRPSGLLNLVNDK
jgi:hypothetical protein